MRRPLGSGAWPFLLLALAMSVPALHHESLHHYEEFPPSPLPNNRVDYMVYRCHRTDGPTTIFRIGVVAVVNNESFTVGMQARSYIAGLKVLVKAANTRRVRVALGNGTMATVNFEGHLFLWDTFAAPYQTPNSSAVFAADQLALYESLGRDLQMSAVILITRGSRGTSAIIDDQVPIRMMEEMKILVFTANGDGQDIEPVSGERFMYRWDLTPPVINWAQPYMKQISLVSASDERLRKVAIVFGGLAGGSLTAMVNMVTSLGLEVALVEVLPFYAYRFFLAKAPDGTWIDTGPAHYWRALATNISKSGAGSVLYTGLFELLSLLRRLRDLKVELPGSLWASPVYADPSFGMASIPDTQYMFLTSQLVTRSDMPDPLYGTLENFREMLKNESAGPEQAYEGICTPIAVVGTILRVVMEDHLTADKDVITRKLASLSIPDSIAGILRFGSHRYLDEQNLKLFQIFDGMRTAVVPARYAERLLKFPVPSYQCRGVNSTTPRSCSCSPGQVGNQDSMRCVPCPAGYFSSGGLGAQCEPCSPGFSSTEGAASCAPCANGTYADKPASAACLPCAAGLFADMEGLSQCTLCPKGRFTTAIGSKCCDTCPGLLTTLEPGGTGPEQCTCSVGTYFRTLGLSLFNGTCLPCSEGMHCHGGRSQPLQKAGYQVVVREDSAGVGAYEAFVCQDAKRCPGSTPVASCPPHRIHLACDFCEVGWRPGRDGGACKECNAAVGVEAAVFASVALLLLAGFTWAVKEGSMRVIFQSRLTLVCCLTILATTGQILNSFEGMDLSRFRPMNSLHQVWSMFSIRLDIIQMGCSLGVSSALQHYACSMTLYPLVLLLFTMLFGLSKRSFCTQAAVLWNGLGQLALLVYLPATLLAFDPFRCGENPSGRLTLVSYRSTICWEDAGHTVMVVIAVLAILAFPLTVLAFVARATWVFPARLAGSRCNTWLRWHNFIFQRFKPEHYYYGLVHLLRSFLIGVLPAVFVNETELRLLLLGLILAATGHIQAVRQPWRSVPANFLDIVVSICCCLTVIVAALLFNGSRSVTITVAEWFMIVNIVVLFGITFIFIIYSLLRTWWPPKTYGIFLSHHKGGGGVLARLLKMLLSARTGGAIFLDSDELDDVGLLVSTVAFSSKNLIMILTNQTLRRFWCAMELAAAMRPGCGVNVVPLACDDYEPPPEGLLDSLGALWRPAELAIMSTHGISIPDVRRAYEKLLDMHPVYLHRSGPLSCIEAAVDEALSRCVGLTTFPVPSTWLDLPAVAPPCNLEESCHVSFCETSAEGPRRVGLVITGAVEDTESHLLCYVLQLYLQREMEAEVAIVRTARQLKHICGQTHMVVLLTPNLLISPSVREVLVASSGLLQLVPVQADSNFSFPGNDFYDSLKAEPDNDTEALVQRFQDLFSTIAFSFSPHASQETHLMEVRAIKRRSLDREARNSKMYSLAPQEEEPPPTAASQWKQRVESACAAVLFPPKGKFVGQCCSTGTINVEEDDVGVEVTPMGVGSLSVAAGRGEAGFRC